jgi:hypothetical protein
MMGPMEGGIQYGRRSSPQIEVYCLAAKITRQLCEGPVKLKQSKRRRALPTSDRLEDVGFPESVPDMKSGEVPKCPIRRTTFAVEDLDS